MAEEIDKLLNEVKTEFDASDKKLKSQQSDELQIPENLSSIQNAFLVVLNQSEELVQAIADRLATIEKNELITVLLKYKMYEIRYDFTSKIAQLTEEKRKLENLGVTEQTASQIAFKMVEIVNSIAECEELHQQQHAAIIEQILQAQAGYENSVCVLDNSLEQLKRNLDYLSLFAEARKAELSSQQDVGGDTALQNLEEAINHFTELQTSGWKAKTEVTCPEARGLKIRDDGMLETQSGRLITYDEARDQNLLDDLRMSDFIKGPPGEVAREGASSGSSASGEESKSSEKSRMTSEDVAYLIEHLGTPLTLALAEITAVQPRDPIHYLGHWLFKYLYNREVSDRERIELDQLTEERTRLARERWHQFVEEEARAAVYDMIARAEEEAIRAELLRIERQLLEQEEEEEMLDDEARDKFGPYDENVGLKL